jgi:hypothetical protein
LEDAVSRAIDAEGLEALVGALADAGAALAQTIQDGADGLSESEDPQMQELGVEMQALVDTWESAYAAMGWGE